MRKWKNISGITVDIQERDNDQINVEPIQWDFLPSGENVNVSNYIKMVEDITLREVLFDAEIMDYTLSINETLKMTHRPYNSCKFAGSQFIIGKIT